MDAWGWGWIAWGVLFLVEEIPALVATKNGQGTLTWHVRHWFATDRAAKGPLVRTRRVVLLCGLVWLAVHFLAGGWI